jgi:hypothetical protein
MRLPELPEHEARYVRDYVNSQSHGDEAGVVQKVGSRRVMGRVHDMYDVHCERSRWWVITDPTNLYLQDDFPEVDQALIFHLGLGIFMAERSRAELPEAEEERVSGAWRRFKQALSAMDDAGESEDFQAVGIKCRDALLAVVRDHMAAEWVGEVEDPPKVSDFKGWGNIFAERLADGRVRSYIKALVDKTWDLNVWLQHNTNATPDDAELVLDATGHFLSALGRLIHRRDHGEPVRCPVVGRTGSMKMWRWSMSRSLGCSTPPSVELAAGSQSRHSRAWSSTSEARSRPSLTTSRGPLTDHPTGSTARSGGRLRRPALTEMRSRPGRT